MIRAAALAAPFILPIAGLLALLDAPSSEAQGFRGGVAYATVSMICSPGAPRKPGNIIVYASTGQTVKAGTMVTVTYMEPISTVSWLGNSVVSGWVQKKIVYRIKHTMGSSDPEGVGVTGLCVSAHYTSNKPVLSQ